MWQVVINGHLAHSAKGTEWANHKYIKKVNGTYYYPQNSKNGGTGGNNGSVSRIANLTGMKDEEVANLQKIANSKGYNSKEYKQALSVISEGDSKMAKQITSIFKKSAKTSEGYSDEDYDVIAQDVVKGHYGNGGQRKQLLGTHYDAIQKRVNELLRKKSAK